MEGRLIEVTRILLDSEDEITIKTISDELGVSGKTIRNYLDKIEHKLTSFDLYVDKVPGVGIMLKGSESNKLKLRNSLSSSFYDEEVSPQNRQESIIVTILMNNNKYSIDKLARRLFVSNSTVYKDIAEIEASLNSQGLELVTRSGKYSIEGDEKSIRKLLSKIIIKNKSNLVDVEDIENISVSTVDWVQNNFGYNYKSIEKFLHELEDVLNTTFSETIFTSLILHLSVSLYRVQHGKTVELPEKIKESIIKSPDYEIVKDFAAKFYRNFNLEIEDQEILYITLHILTNRNYTSTADYQELFGEDENIDISVAVAKEIISISSKSLDLDLSGDEVFFNSLVLHLIPTVTRLKSSLSLKNPILNEIKSKYTETFGLAWMSCLLVEKNLGVRIPESEIGYIAIHIGAAIERNKKKIKSRIESDRGYGTEQFIKSKLEKEFPELEFIDSSLEKVDLLFSTISETGDDVINIDPLLAEIDIKEIRRFIDEFYNKQTDKRNLHQKLFYKDDSNSKEELLEKMCKYAEQEGFITDEYLNTVLNREKILSTEVGNLVAIPHGLSSEVIESCVVLTVLKEEIDWNPNKVKYVFLVCLNDKDLSLGKDIFSNLSNTMTSNSFYRNLDKDEESCQREFDKLIKVH